MFLYKIGWMYCWVHTSAERRLIKQKKWEAWSARTDGRRLSPNRRRPWIGSERCCATSRDSTRLEICVGGRVVCICPVRGRDFLAFVRLKVLVKAGVSSCYYGNPRCSDVRKEHFDRRTCRLSPPLSHAIIKFIIFYLYVSSSSESAVRPSSASKVRVTYFECKRPLTLPSPEASDAEWDDTGNTMTTAEPLITSHQHQAHPHFITRQIR